MWKLRRRKASSKDAGATAADALVELELDEQERDWREAASSSGLRDVAREAERILRLVDGELDTGVEPSLVSETQRILTQLKEAILLSQQSISAMDRLGHQDLEKADYLEQVLKVRKQDLDATQKVLDHAIGERDLVLERLRPNEALLAQVFPCKNGASGGNNANGSTSSVGSCMSVTSKGSGNSARVSDRAAASMEAAVATTQRSIEAMGRQLCRMSDELIELRKEKDRLRQKLSLAEKM